MIKHEASPLLVSAVAKARRFQQDQLVRVVTQSGRDGICAVEIQKRLMWPFDTAIAEIERALDAGEITFRPGDDDDDNPRYIAAAALSQADEGAP